MQFSIVIPVYNVAPYLRECVDSVLAQNSTDYEIILVDDGSTDNSPAICDEYAEKYSQIKVIHKANGGLSDARNFGIKKAQGDYLMFLDSDDFWNRENVLLDLHNIIKENNPDLIIHELSSFYNSEKIILRKFKNKEIQNFSYDFKEDLKYLVNNDIYYATACNKIIKTSIVKENNIEFPKGKLHEDIAWCADIISHIDKYTIYEKSFYFYRQEREGAITNKIHKKNIEDILYVISDKKDKLSKINGGLEYLYGSYMACLGITLLLEKKERNSCFNKLEEFKFLLNFHPRRNSLKAKIPLLIYKVLGLKYGSSLIHYIKKVLI
jgi:glycosyltransferase